MINNTHFLESKLFKALLIIILLLHTVGFWQSTVIVDSSLYAIISKTMAESNNFIDIYVNGVDWLDKPHFPFWICALSMKVFGVSVFAYKLPAFLFFLLSLIFTFKIAKELYNSKVGWMAVLMLSTALHLVMSNNDVRAEPYLMGALMPSIYYLLKLIRNIGNLYFNIFWMALFTAIGIMTKGVFFVIPIGAALFFELLLSKKLKDLLHWKWFAYIILAAIFTLPEVYAVYVQFDLHPEKVVFGETGVSGVSFFLWDSQFGRFFNTGPIKGRGDLGFFLHTTLWAFAPWAFYGFYALFVYVKSIFKEPRKVEYISLFGFLILFIIFSISKFQLPHYINMILPFMAIFSANLFLKDYESNHSRTWLVYIPMLLMILFIIPVAMFIDVQVILATIIVILFSVLSIILFRLYKNYLLLLMLASIGFYSFLNFAFYPFLYQYQGNTQAAYFINSSSSINKIIASRSYDLEFNLQKPFEPLTENHELKKGDYIFCSKTNLELINAQYVTDTIEVFEDYRVTQLTPKFLNPTTRNQVTEKLYLVKVK